MTAKLHLPKAKSNSNLAYFFSALYLTVIILSFSLYELQIQHAIAYGVHFVIASLGLGFAFHRVIIHRSVEVSPFVLKLTSLLGVLSNTGSPLDWSMSHYLHHIYPDTEKDPHSPLSGWKVLFGFYNTKSIEKNFRQVFSAIKPVAQNPWFLFLHNYYYYFIGGFYLLCFLLGGFEGLLFWGLLPSALSYFSINVTNYFNHGPFGYRSFETPDKSKNVWFLFFLTFGENWHNNHHQRPKHWNNWNRWWEVDVPAIYCFFLRKDFLDHLKYQFKKLLLKISKKDSDYVY